MRFTEIASPEDQLALWKLVSDKMWAAFSQQANQNPDPEQAQQGVPSNTKATAKLISLPPVKPLAKSKTTQVKVHKPKKAPMAPAPKPLPKPAPLHPSSVQDKQSQLKQSQQLAKHVQQALAKKLPGPGYPQPAQSRGAVTTNSNPINSSYSVRDKDEIVMHSRENPLVPLKPRKPHF